MTAMHAP
jgi:hypothetical protein